jgi:type II secretory pathway pseudopilin PulG
MSKPMPNVRSIAKSRRALESLVVVAVLGAVAWTAFPRLSLGSSRDEAKRMQSTLWQVRNRVELNRFSNLVRINDEGWPMAISPEWFKAERLPPHPLTDRELIVETTDAGHAMHYPIEKTFDPNDPDARTLWYNRTNGSIAIRVPRVGTDAEMLAAFNAVNGTGLGSTLETAR